MTVTYDSIQTTTLTTTTTSVTFSNLSSSYTDFLIIIQASTNHTDDGARGYMRFNSDTGSNYSNTFIRGDGVSSSMTSNKDLSQTYIAYGVVGNNSSTFGTQIIHVMNYANTNTIKSTVSRSGTPRSGDNGKLRITVGRWNSTSRIDSITFLCDGSYRADSTFTIYGIKCE